MKHSLRMNIFLQFTVQFSNFLIIPIAMVSLEDSEFTYWVIFFTISTLSPIFLLGFESSIFRHSAYIKSGATKLRNTGMENFIDSNSVDIALFNDFIVSVRDIIRLLSSLEGLLLAVGGTLFLQNLQQDDTKVENLFLSWSVFVIGMLLGNLGIFRDAVLRGFDLQIVVNVAAIAGRIVFVTYCLAFYLFFDLNLLTLSIGYTFSVVVFRMLIWRAWKNRLGSIVHQTKATLTQMKKFFHLMWTNSSKALLIYIGNFITLRSGILILPFYIGTDSSSRYILYYTLVLAISAVAIGLASLFLPQLHFAHFQSNRNEIARKFSLILTTGVYSFVIGVSIIIFIAKIAFISGFEKYGEIQLGLFLLICFCVLCELLFTLAGMYFASMNDLPHYKSALISALMYLVAINILGNGISPISLSLIQLGLGSIYNSWYWMRKVHLSTGTNVVTSLFTGTQTLLKLLISGNSISGRHLEKYEKE